MYSPDHTRLPGTTLPGAGGATSTDAVLFAGGRVEATVHTPDSASRRYVHALVETPFGVRLLFGEAEAEPEQAVDAARHLLDAFRAEAPRVAEPTALGLRLATSLLDAYTEAHGHGRRLLARMMLLEYRADRSLTIVNRGYPAPLLVSHRRTRELEPPLPTPPIGVLAPGSVRPPSLTVAAFPGDRLQVRTRTDAVPTDPAAGGAAWCHVEFDAI